MAKGCQASHNDVRAQSKKEHARHSPDARQAPAQSRDGCASIFWCLALSLPPGYTGPTSLKLQTIIPYVYLAPNQLLHPAVGGGA